MILELKVSVPEVIILQSVCASKTYSFYLSPENFLTVPGFS